MFTVLEKSSAMFYYHQERNSEGLVIKLIVACGNHVLKNGSAY